MFIFRCFLDKGNNLNNLLKLKHLNSKKALSYIVAISLLAYNNVQKEEEFNSSPEVVLCLTESLCSHLKLEASNAPRYLTSLYHIQHFLVAKVSFTAYLFSNILF